MKTIWLILIGFGSVIVLDFIWLGLLMKGFYEKYVGFLMGPTKIVPALLVWALIAVGVVLFVLPKATSLSTAIIWGALFGFVLYGVYEFTNYALVKNWPWQVVAVDLAWGTVLCTAVAVILYYLN